MRVQLLKCMHNIYLEEFPGSLIVRFLVQYSLQFFFLEDKVFVAKSYSLSEQAGPVAIVEYKGQYLVVRKFLVPSFFAIVTVDFASLTQIYCISNTA